MEFIHNEIVRMYDVDLQGITHYSSYYRFFTNAIEDFSLSLFGKSLSNVTKNVWFVTVSSKAEYIHPTYIDDPLSIKLKVSIKSRSVIIFKFDVFRHEKVVCRGELVQVAIDRERWKTTAIPKFVLDRIKKNH